MAVVFYDGPSQIDGSTTVLALATGLEKPSINRKTGPMVQTWILVKDQSPVDAVRSGEDAAICGNCVHRGTGFADRTCYVNVAQAPQSVWRSKHEVRSTKHLFAHRRVRLGAYGDPTAVPFEVWDRLLAEASGWTGYTQQWREGDQRFRKYCMASVTTEADEADARALGWRTYRVIPTYAAPPKDAVLCPASGDSPITCHSCMLCGGTGLRRSAKSVYIPVHGVRRIISIFDRGHSWQQNDSTKANRNSVTSLKHPTHSKAAPTSLPSAQRNTHAETGSAASPG